MGSQCTQKKNNVLLFFLLFLRVYILTGVPRPIQTDVLKYLSTHHLWDLICLLSWIFYFFDIYFTFQINFSVRSLASSVYFIVGTCTVPLIKRPFFEHRANELTRNGPTCTSVAPVHWKVDSKEPSVMSSNCSSHHNFVFIWFWTDTKKLFFRSGRWLSRWQFSWKVCVVRCTLEEAFLKYFIRTDCEVLRCKFFYDQLSATRECKLNCT